MALSSSALIRHGNRDHAEDLLSICSSLWRQRHLPTTLGLKIGILDDCRLAQ
jgi:hypothetical protein